MAFDLSKPVKTRGDTAKGIPSKPVRILAIDMPGDYPIGGLIDGFANLDRWTVDGRMFAMGGSAYDLINAPERHVRWVNFYRGSDGGVYGGSHFHTRDDADEYEYEAKDPRIACVRIEFAEGDGL